LEFPEEEVLRVFLQIAQLHRRGKEATKQFLHARVVDRISKHPRDDEGNESFVQF